MNSNAALALLDEPGMIISSDLFGSLTVSPEELIDFPGGLFGFPECRGFVLIPAERTGLYWLQSAEHGALAFLLVDPFLFFDGYAVDVAPVDLADLGGESAEIAILAIVTLPRERGGQPTANLQGPLAVNLALRTGKQLAIAESQFGVRCPFSLADSVGAG